MAKLYFYYSTMNAGKSTTLLQSSYNYRERNMNTMVYTAAIVIVLAQAKSRHVLVLMKMLIYLRQRVTFLPK